MRTIVVIETIKSVKRSLQIVLTLFMSIVKASFILIGNVKVFAARTKGLEIDMCRMLVRGVRVLEVGYFSISVHMTTM